MQKFLYSKSDSSYTPLGIMSDFLRTFPTCDPDTLWSWPTLSPVDYQFTIWLLTYGYRKRTLHRTQRIGQSSGNDGSIQISSFGEVDNTTFTAFQSRSRREIQDSALLEVLGGYYDLAKTAVFLTLLLRLGTGGLTLAWLARNLRIRRLWKL